MAHITFDYYEVWHHGRSCQILIPGDISRFWTTWYRNLKDQLGPDIDFFGNRKGLEMFRNACAAMSEKNNLTVYIPCRKNSRLFLDRYFSLEPEWMEFVDLVFMKPNSLKIEDWKEIRRCLPRMKSRQWGYDFPDGSRFIYKGKKKEYRKETLKMTYRYNTIFLNALSCEYADWVSYVEEFLEPNLEKNFLEDMIRFHNGEKGVILRGQTSCLFGWCAPRTNGAGVFFWDDDIFQKAEDKICLGI